MQTKWLGLLAMSALMGSYSLTATPHHRTWMTSR